MTIQNHFKLDYGSSTNTAVVLVPYTASKRLPSSVSRTVANVESLFVGHWLVALTKADPSRTRCWPAFTHDYVSIQASCNATGVAVAPLW